MELWKRCFNDVEKQREQKLAPWWGFNPAAKAHVNPLPVGPAVAVRRLQWVDVKTLTVDSVLLRFHTWPTSVIPGDLTSGSFAAPPCRWHPAAACTVSIHTHASANRTEKSYEYSELLYVKNCTLVSWETQMAFGSLLIMRQCIHWTSLLQGSWTLTVKISANDWPFGVIINSLFVSFCCWRLM